MKVVVRAKAADDLVGIFEWISTQSPSTAIGVVLRLRRRITVLEMPECAYIGRPGRDEGSRELVEGNYIIVYEVNKRRQTISILAIVRGARDR